MMKSKDCTRSMEEAIDTSSSEGSGSSGSTSDMSGPADSNFTLNRSPHSTGRQISNVELFIHFVKGNLGTGILAMPSAFQKAGLWVGAVALPVMAIICTHSMQMLVNAAEEMKNRQGDFIVSYAHVAETACLTGAKQFHKFAKPARLVINTFICITQIGFCCVFLVFVGDNLQQVVSHFTELDWDSRVYMAIVSVPLVFLNWIRNLKLLTPVSVISNILQIFSIVVVFYYVVQDLPSITTRPAFQTWGGLPLFFGTAIYTFEGIALVLPLQKDMKRPQDFRGCTGLLNIGMFTVASLYLSVGLFGYWKYGEDIESSITLNLPNGHILAQMVKISMVAAICGSYAMQLYVPIPIMWPSISKYFRFIGSDVVAECIFRTVIVMMICGFAVAIPRLDLFISLVGAFGSSFLGLIFPPILDLVVHWPKVSTITLLKNLFIIVFGLAGFATGTYASVQEIVKAFN